ncbi:MAG: TOMM precursor leader peptide-binding protein [Cyanosarcina radialis HA8281-LM2]|jgi:ribosomal protein S12 methylthiotransferase accessory factor|nr:TOMM precursor leader peptide-binding protein [Cyanosarcina radialis HA8281-LM2]
MLERPHFKPCYSVSTVAPDQVFLLSERETVCLSDRFLYLVASLIDGDRTSDEIIDAIQVKLLPKQQTPQDISTFFQEALDVSIKAQAALFHMEKAGYLVEGDYLLPSNLITFCHHLNIDSDLASQRLKSTKVAVESFASLGKSDLIANLQALNVQIANESDLERVDLTVVLTDDYLHPKLEDFNQKSIRSPSPWMLVKPLGTVVWLGPLFDSQTTACWQCLASRLQNNRPVAGYVQRVNRQSVAPISPPGFLPSTLQTALGMAATEVFKWIVRGENDRLKNTLIAYDTLTLQ